MAKIHAIDLGTNNIRVATYENNLIKIFTKDDGLRVTPAFAYQSEENKKLLTGYKAKYKAKTSLQNSVYGLKRLIGENAINIEDIIIEHVFIKIITDNDGTFKIKTVGDLIYTPLEIYSKILLEIKNNLESNADKNVVAIITIPVCYTEKQRDNLREAARNAGITVRKLVHESEAVALRYFYEFPNEHKHLLIFSLGAGYCEVAIVKKRSSGEKFQQVIAKSRRIGGNDFDYMLFKYAKEELLKIYNYNCTLMQTSALLLRKCEEAKIILTSADKTTISLNNMDISLSKIKLKSILINIFQQCIDIIKLCLDEGNLDKILIKQVILSGGSTRIPKLQKMIQDFFGKNLLNKVLNIDECVAEGGALAAFEIAQQKTTQNHDHSISMSDFKILEVVGKGSSGEVLKVEHIPEKNIYAIKLIQVEHNNMKTVKREIKALQMLNHPNVVRYYNSWSENIECTTKMKMHTYSNSFNYNQQENIPYLLIQMEYCKYNLLKLLKSLSKINKSQKMHYCLQIINGVQQIHKHQIIHRDLKPENIFMGIDNQLKIGDFGTSTSFVSNNYSQNVGTKYYRSPEMLNSSQYNLKVDIYALGIIFYEIISRFKEVDQRFKGLEYLYKKNDVDQNFKSKHPDESNLIKAMISKSPDLRIDSPEVLKQIHNILDKYKCKPKNPTNCYSFK